MVEWMHALAWADHVVEFGYGLLALLAGVYVLYMAPGKRPNQALALLLLVDGIGLGGIMADMMSWSAMTPAFRFAAQGTVVISAGLIPLLYINFIRHALPGSIAQFFQNRYLFRALAVLTVVNTVYRLGYLSPSIFTIPDVLAYALFAVPLVVSGLLGFAATLQFVRSAQTDDDRKRSRAYLRAFISRDVGYIVAYGGWFATFWWTPPNLELLDTLAVVFLGVCWLLFLAFLMYGVLTGSVVDLDRKVRLGISSTTAAAIVAMLFLILVESVESLFNAKSTVLSVLFAVALTFLFQPLQVAAQRATHRLVPGPPISSSDYEAALHRALEDGRITRREQRLLDDLRHRVADAPRRD